MQAETQQNEGKSKQNGAAGASAAHATVPATVDELVQLDTDTLARLYQQASLPQLGRIEGDLKGRMLAWQGFKGLAADLVRALGNWDRFPWRGKSFSPRSADNGEGINRVLSDRFKLFKFTTFVAPSRAGAFESVQLDYDHPGNPFFIRAIKDEIRELRPGLYLGQAYLHLRDTDRLVLYFGLQMG
jgi:hypothetical protein